MLYNFVGNSVDVGGPSGVCSGGNVVWQMSLGVPRFWSLRQGRVIWLAEVYVKPHDLVEDSKTSKTVAPRFCDMATGICWMLCCKCLLVRVLCVI